MSGSSVTGDGWCGWTSGVTGDGWPRSLEGVTGDGWCPIQEGKTKHRHRGRRPRLIYEEIPKGPPVTPPNVPELSFNPPLGQHPHLARDISAELARADREREIAIAQARRAKQNQRALELLLMDD